MGQAKIRAEQAKAAATTTGRVPISVDTTLRLSRLWFELQGAQRAAQQAQAAVAAAATAYIEGLSGVVEARDLGVDAFTAGANPTETQARVSVDFKARELVLPPTTPAPEQPTEQPKTPPAEGGT